MSQVIRAALYARVSSQKQADEATIESQRQAVIDRIKRDQLILQADLEFCDEGYSGSQLLRPALERLRDHVHYGLVDRLYIHSPDRLAREFAHQAILLDEFTKHHCDVIFLSQEGLPASPEANLLIQMQGMIAEYEREKILERTRRGRRFAAAAGKVSVFAGAPYGYRYVTKQEGSGEARWEIDPLASHVIKLIFDLVGNAGQTLGSVCRELARQGHKSPTGNSGWSRATVHDMLSNPAYYGQARYGRERLAPRKPGRRAKRGDPPIPRRAQVAVATKPEEQVTISVPAIISEALFNKVAVVMQENRKRQREQKKGTRYLLSGLLVCGQCGSAYCGRTQGGRPYYRCLGTDKHRLAQSSAEPTRLCDNTSVQGIELETQVWSELCNLLRQPKRLGEELERRRAAEPKTTSQIDKQRQRVKSLRDRLDRLIDAFENGLLAKTEFEARIVPLREKHDRETLALANYNGDDEPPSDAIASLEAISKEVNQSLNNASFDLKRKLMKLLIKRVEIHLAEVRIIYKVPTRPFLPSPASVRGELHHCTLRPAAPPVLRVCNFKKRERGVRASLTHRVKIQKPEAK